MQKTLDAKLQTIAAGQYTADDFIIADAKDGDMAFGTLTPAPQPGGAPGRRRHHLDEIEAMTRSGLVDVMLMSASTGEILSRQGLFDDSPVTPAVRMNDTTDIWSARSSRYRAHVSLPFASADIDAVEDFCNLGLYSMTFSNDTEADRRSLEAYKAFRLDIREHDFRHFLEIFNPAFDVGVSSADLGFYINDMIIKALAGVTAIDTPRFLKIQFNGYAAMNDLASYDPERLIVGILGGSRGTTRDTFELAHQAEQAGARVALFGRKINFAESPLELVRLMRDTLTQRVTPEQAVRQYHDHLAEQGIVAQRSLEDDLAITDPVLMAS